MSPVHRDIGAIQHRVNASDDIMQTTSKPNIMSIPVGLLHKLIMVQEERFVPQMVTDTGEPHY